MFQWETPGENKCRCAAANTQCVSRDKMCRFAATSGRIPIMTNSAIPNPKVPNAKASKLFFITTVFRYRRSPTERSLSRCDRKRFVRATATVPPERRPGVRFADREARKYRKPDIEVEQTSRFSLYAENRLRRIMFYFRKKQTRCVGFFSRYVYFSSYITGKSPAYCDASDTVACCFGYCPT